MTTATTTSDISIPAHISRYLVKEWPGNRTFALSLPLKVRITQIEGGNYMWIPRKAPPMKIKALVGATRLFNPDKGKNEWWLDPQDLRLEDYVKLPHISGDMVCIQPHKLKGDSVLGWWPINTGEEMGKAIHRLERVLGGIDLNSLATPIAYWDERVFRFIPKAMVKILKTPFEELDDDPEFVAMKVTENRVLKGDMVWETKSGQ